MQGASPDLNLMLSTIQTLVVLIMLGSVLKAFNIMPAEFAPMINRVVLTVTLPALVFRAIRSTAGKALGLELLKIPLLAVLVILGCAGLGYLIANRVLHLDRKRTGVFLLSVMFGSTAFVGYPLFTTLTNDGGLSKQYATGARRGGLRLRDHAPPPRERAARSQRSTRSHARWTTSPTSRALRRTSADGWKTYDQSSKLPLPLAQGDELRGEAALGALEVGVQLGDSVRDALLDLGERLAQLRAGGALPLGEGRAARLADSLRSSATSFESESARARERPARARRRGRRPRPRRACRSGLPPRPACGRPGGPAPTRRRRTTTPSSSAAHTESAFFFFKQFVTSSHVTGVETVGSSLARSE